MLHLSKNIRLIRLLLDKTQPEFGRMFNATKAMIISYEKGRAVPDELFINRLSKAAGISDDDLKNKELKEENFKFYRVKKVQKGEIVSAKNLSSMVREELDEQQTTEAATVRMLFNEVAKLKAKIYGIDISAAISEMEQNTTLIIKDILKSL